MHPLFGSADPNLYPGSSQLYQQQQPNYGGQQFAPMPVEAQQMPPSGLYSPPSGHYSPPSGQYSPPEQHQAATANPTINYQNFQTFTAQQHQQQQQQMSRQTMSPPAPEPPKQKPPLPEEFIYLQTVLEELKTQCINAAGNPVSSNVYFAQFE